MGILRLNSDGNEDLHVGTLVRWCCLALSRWVGDTEWLMAEHRVLPILLSTLMAWFKRCLALVQLSTPLQHGCKRILAFCGSIRCKGLALKAQKSGHHVQMTNVNKMKVRSPQGVSFKGVPGESISMLFLWDVWEEQRTEWNKHLGASQCVKLPSGF